MEENKNNMEEPTTSKNTTEQDKSKKLTGSEKAIRQEVECLLQTALDTLLTEGEEESKEEGESPTLQDEGEAPLVKEKTGEGKGRLTLKSDEVRKSLEVVEEEDEEEVVTKKESDSLILMRDEILKLDEEDEEENKRESDRLTLLSDEELMLLEEEDEDQEETKKGTGGLTLQEEGEEPPEKEKAEEKAEHLTSPDEVLKAKKEGMEKVEEEEEETKQTSNSTRSRVGSLWALHRQKIQEIAHKQRISKLPPGYFAKLGKVLDLPGFQELLEWRSRTRKWDPNPRLARMFTVDDPEEQLKKVTRTRPTSQRDGHFSRLPDMVSEDFLHLEDKKPLVTITESEQEDHPSGSPESLSAFVEISPESKKEEAETAAKGYGTQPTKPQCESFYSYQGLPSSVWTMGQRISHWRLAHHRGYHADQLSQDKIYKQRLLKHERETKAAVPLPLQDVIEEEVMAILTDTLKDYQKKLGPEHPLSLQMEDQVDRLQVKLHRKGVL